MTITGWQEILMTILFPFFFLEGMDLRKSFCSCEQIYSQKSSDTEASLTSIFRSIISIAIHSHYWDKSAVFIFPLSISWVRV